MQYMEENMLNMCLKQDFIAITLLIIVAMIFKVFSRLFIYMKTVWYGSDIQ